MSVWAAVIELLELKPQAAISVEEAFAEADERSKGNLNIQELFKVFTLSGVKLDQADLDRLASDLDTNNSGQVSFVQFLAAVQKNKALLMGETSEPKR